MALSRTMGFSPWVLVQSWVFTMGFRYPPWFFIMGFGLTMGFHHGVFIMVFGPHHGFWSHHGFLVCLLRLGKAGWLTVLGPLTKTL